MTKKRNSTRADRLAAIRKRLGEESLSGGKGFWKPKEGRSIIRILPGVGEMGEFFWQDVGKHYIPGQKFAYICPDFTIGEKCPICEMVQELYDAGDDASKKLAGEMRVGRQYWMNVIVRGQEGKGPLIFTPGVTIFREIASLVEDPDYGDIFDPADGVDITIKRTGTTRSDTEYNVNPRRKSSPLAPSGEYEDMTDEWLEKAVDLSPVMLNDNPDDDSDIRSDDAVVYVKPYERLKAEFEQLDIAGEDEEEEIPFPEDEEEEDDDKGKIRDVLQRRRTSRRRRRSR